MPLYGLAFAVGNLCGPLILAPLFDSVGRKPMISGTYIISGVLLAISGWLFDQGDLTATTQTFCWIVIFFFASAGASAAYLTVSETWPIEIRAEAIAVFFAIAQIFGAFGPVFYGWLIGDGSDPTGLFIGYVDRGSDHGHRRDRRAPRSGSRPRANRSKTSRNRSRPRRTSLLRHPPASRPSEAAARTQRAVRCPA